MEIYGTENKKQVRPLRHIGMKRTIFLIKTIAMPILGTVIIAMSIAIVGLITKCIINLFLFGYNVI